MNNFTMNPYVRLTMYSTLIVPTEINRRIIFDYELIYIEKGTFLLIYDDKKYQCQQGDFLLLCPNIPHSFHVLTTEVVQPHIHFDLEYDRYSERIPVSFRDYCDLSAQEQLMVRINSFPQLARSPFIQINKKEEFLRLFFEVVNAKNLSSLSVKAQMLQLLEHVIHDNIEVIPDFESVQTHIAVLIKEYLDSNYTNSISLDMLEQQFNYSKYYLEKLFRDKYGLSIMAYRSNRRMELAVSLLRTYSVSDTASMLGFSSIYTFSRAFRNKYGCSPSKYQKK